MYFFLYNCIEKNQNETHFEEGTSKSHHFGKFNCLEAPPVPKRAQVAIV